MKYYAIEIALRGNVEAKNKDQAVEVFFQKVADGVIKREGTIVVIGNTGKKPKTKLR